jgi:UDP-N-acetylmuramoyl-L-alanyl-D-glutamate--2,6-diaminopimelate ligase
MLIIDEVANGAKKSNKSVKKILERRKGIRVALRSAKEDDIVVITGKGCEPWMCVAHGKKIAWDDRKVAKEEFKKLKL